MEFSWGYSPKVSVKVKGYAGELHRQRFRCNAAGSGRAACLKKLNLVEVIAQKQKKNPRQNLTENGICY